MSVFTAFKTVALMLLCAVPGYLMIKTKLIKSDAIASFAKILLFICQPCLVFTALTGVTYAKWIAIDLLIVFSIILTSELVMTGILLIIFRKKKEEVRFRIYTVASCMDNVGFMGVPVISALLPGNAEAIAFTAAASLALNVYGWTIGSAVIAHDGKFITPKKIILNPATVAILVTIPFFVMNVSLPISLGNTIDVIGKFSTPLCMIVMGARLACTGFKKVFLRPGNYLAVALKQIIFPLLVLGALLLLPVRSDIRSAVFILACCPVASMVLNFSELLEKGREEAAGVLLLGTVLSCLTIPLMLLLV